MLETGRHLEDPELENAALGNLGSVFLNQGEYSLALEYYHKALEISQAIGDRGSECGDLSNLGLVYESQRDYVLAQAYYQKALVLSQLIGDRDSEGVTLANLSSLHVRLKDYPRALMLGLQAGEVLLEIQSPDVVHVRTTLNKIYHIIGQTEFEILLQSMFQTELVTQNNLRVWEELAGLGENIHP